MTTKIFVTPDGSEFSSKEQAIEYQELQFSKDQAFAEKRMEFLRLREIAGKANSDLFAFQSNCEHQYVTVKPESDTGNWCKSDDSYWYVITCKCCELRWQENQDTSKYGARTDENVEWIK
jgi:hypothetical protein